MTADQAIKRERRQREAKLASMLKGPERTFVGRAQEQTAMRRAESNNKSEGIWDPNEDLERILSYSLNVAQQ